MARKYWKLSSAGHEYVTALLKKLEWQSLGYSELAQTLRETKDFTIDRETLTKILDPHSKHKNNRSKLEDLIKALDPTKDPTTKAFAQQYFEQIENHSISKPEEKLNDSIKETLAIQDKERFRNPFQPLSGRIEHSEQFFNRDRELREIFDILNAGSGGVELLGDIQVGKSSVLKQIEKRSATELKDRREVIYFNLQEVRTEEEFYEVLGEKLGVRLSMDYRFIRVMREKRILLLLDKLEKMILDNGFTRQIGDQLHSLTEGENASLRLVVASRTPIELLVSGSHTSPFQGICLRVNLKPWKEPTVRNFVRTKLESTGIRFSESEMQKLWEESLGHPQKLMKACFDLYRQYNPKT